MNTTQEDLLNIAAFSAQPRQYVKFCEGDVFRFKINRRLYGYGRILLDYTLMRKKKESFWDVLAGKPLVCSVYHIATALQSKGSDPMDGVFFKRNNTKIYNILGLLAGLYIVLQFGFFFFADTGGNLDDILASCFFILFGLFMIVLCAVSLYVNCKVYIHVDEDSISAYCQFGLSLNCSISDVADVTYGGGGLNITLRNGKKYNLMLLENAHEVGRYIQKRMAVKTEGDWDLEELTAQLPVMKKKCVQEGVTSICVFFLLIPGILLTSALTGWKDLSEFTKNDWIVFLSMAVIGIADIIVFCSLLRKYLRHLDSLNNKRRILSQMLLKKAPLRPGNAIGLYVDDENYPSFRLTVYGFPNSSEVYYTVEAVDQNFEVQLVEESRIFESAQALEEVLEGNIPIGMP